MKSRIKSCLEQLPKYNCDSLLISDAVNIEYLTGAKQQDGYLLLGLGAKPIYFTNFLYQKEAQSIKFWQTVVTSLSGKTSNIFSLIAKEIKKLNCKRVGFEAKSLAFLEQKVLKELLAGKATKFVETRDLIASLRMIKDNRELALIKKSTQVSLEAFEFAKEILSSQISEKRLGLELERFLRLRSDNEIAFKPIVASGPNTVFPHHQPSSGKLARDLFLIDLGSRYCGYCADLTRMFFQSKMPILFKRIYQAVRTAQDLAFKKIKDGVRVAEVDKAARDFIDQKGWAKYFGHGLGHGIGLSVHELPYLRPKSQDILKEGMVVTLEPAVYLNNKFGARIEDMVLVGSRKGVLLSGDVDR